MSNATHNDDLKLPEIDTAPVQRAALIAAILGIVGFVLFGILNMSVYDSSMGIQDFFFAYQCGFVYWLCLPIGAMALLMISYFTTASWGIVFRRSMQAATRTLPLIALLFIPVAVGMFINEGESSPFWWAEFSATADRLGNDTAEIAAETGLRPEAVEENQHKIDDYLNPWFTIGRAAVYFCVFGGIIFFLNHNGRNSEEQENETAKYNLYSYSGPLLILWGFMVTIAVTDMVMSVEPTWASSMFPVIYVMNSFICTFSIGLFTVYGLYRHEVKVMGIIKEKFRIDIGSLLLGFTMVWAYGSFCQYMLIWAGDLPEESVYYLKRNQDGSLWLYTVYFLMAFHWFSPFIIFLFREVKTNPRTMQFMAGLLLTVCSVDVVWWLLPAVYRESNILPALMGLSAIVGVGGLWGLFYAYQLGQRAILPANEETKFLANWGHHH